MENLFFGQTEIDLRILAVKMGIENEFIKC